MIRYEQGNLLESGAEALVNTVNTMGVMGKGIALMFKERFPLNMELYSEACKLGQVKTGNVFVTESNELMGPKWIINFPTKKNWRHPSKMEWVIDGLSDLREFILSNGVKSIAIPPLGAGNGGLDWQSVKFEILKALGDIESVDIIIYEPTDKYQNISKKKGVEKLTIARALVAELVRRYWILGIECSLLEIQKMAWFLERSINTLNLENKLDLRFKSNNYGPYADRLRHLLNGLDGSFLQSEKRLGDARPLDVIWFSDDKKVFVETFLKTEAKEYLPALELTSKLVDGFESPYGMELLSTVDWLISMEKVEPEINSVLRGIENWPAGKKWATRKSGLFARRDIEIAIERLRLLPILN